MKKQTTKKAAPKKAASKKNTSKKAATPKKDKVDEKLIHQIEWLTEDTVNGYLMGVDSDILSKQEIKKLTHTTNNHQELFDYLSASPKTSADFAEFILFYMHTLVFTGAGETVLKEWKEDYQKSSAKKKK